VVRVDADHHSAALKAGDGHITQKQTPLLGPKCKKV
jgi:hypothetical protein